MKPVASGCENTAHGLRNDDAARLIAASSVELDYSLVNPFAFEQPVAPHLAAQHSELCIDKNKIQASFRSISQQVDAVIVEGVGGWSVPINDTETMADVAQAIGLPVILVVGIRLGCINHALLTVAAIEKSGLPFAGWIANRIDKQCLIAEENIKALEQRIDVPLMADVDWMEGGSKTGEIDWRECGLPGF
jgi:dethiobiotin synthetase